MKEKTDNEKKGMNLKLFLVASLTLLSQKGFACKCGIPKNVQEAIPIYDYVFHGKAIRTQVVRVEGVNKRVWNEKLVAFVPDTVYAGKVPDTITVKYQSAMNMCSSTKLNFIVGQFYLIGVDKPRVQKTQSIENGKTMSETNKSIQFGMVYPELDDCGFVQKDPISIYGN